MKNHNSAKHFVLFLLDDNVYAVPLDRVKRIIRAVKIHPLPETPEIILGAVNVQGSIVPVIDLRKRFGLAEHPISLDDHLIIASTSRREIALLVDEVTDIHASMDTEMYSGEDMLPGVTRVQGVIKDKESMILVQDLDRLLSLDEDFQIEQAMEQS